jgi:hypothetical protein
VMCGIIELSPTKALCWGDEELPGGLVTRSGINCSMGSNRLAKGGFSFVQ